MASTASKRKALPGISDKLWTQWQSAKDSGEVDLAWLDEGADRHIITFDDAAYPPQLRHIPDPPPLLFVRGDLSAISAPPAPFSTIKLPTAPPKKWTPGASSVSIGAV